MLGAAAEKDAAVAVVIDLLGLGQAEKLGIEPLRRVDVGHEQFNRADPGDLERPLQHHAAHAMVVRQFLGGTKSGGEVDAAALAIHDLGHLGRLREREAVAHGGKIGRGRFAPAVPADLLHAVIELDAVSVGIEHVERPVAAGKIAAEPADGHLALCEILCALATSSSVPTWNEIWFTSTPFS